MRKEISRPEGEFERNLEEHPVAEAEIYPNAFRQKQPNFRVDWQFLRVAGSFTLRGTCAAFQSHAIR